MVKFCHTIRIFSISEHFFLLVEANSVVLIAIGAICDQNSVEVDQSVHKTMDINLKGNITNFVFLIEKNTIVL